MHGMTRAQWYISDDLLERDTHLKREKRSRLTGSVHVCAVVLLYSWHLSEYYYQDTKHNIKIFGDLKMKFVLIIITLAYLFLLFGCSKNEPVSPNDDTIKYIDGNVYNIINIGEQWWMAENLRVSRYRNGDIIPKVTEIQEWEKYNKERWAYYDNDIINEHYYGKLYNWYVINDERGLCPVGWRVPSDDDWIYLELHTGLSMEDAENIGKRGVNEGNELKSTRTEPDPHPRWNNPNEGVTNYSGFTGLPGGRITGDGFSLLGYHGIWWSSTEATNFSAWVRGLAYDDSSIGRYFYDKRSGISVRCMKE